MGLPNINIEFNSSGASAIARLERGIVALILKDDFTITAKAKTREVETVNVKNILAIESGMVLTSETQIPDNLSTENKDYIKRAFIGYINKPRKVIIYVSSKDSTELKKALAYFENTSFDYICASPNAGETENAELITWVKGQRQDKKTYKAVIASKGSDSEGIINFTTAEIVTGGQTLTASQFCSRIAGLIAGTPINISCTYAPMLDVENIKQLTREEADKAIDKGEFILIHDGEKVKVSRAVNSLTTTLKNKGEAFKKIKIVEAMDMIKNDIRMNVQDNYIGRYANSYDNKLLLTTAISGYFFSLERDGILENNSSTIGIDHEAQKEYLISTGIDISVMDEQKIKEANTGSKVFLKASVKILDAIEDVSLDIAI